MRGDKRGRWLGGNTAQRIARVTAKNRRRAGSGEEKKTSKSMETGGDRKS